MNNTVAEAPACSDQECRMTGAMMALLSAARCVQEQLDAELSGIGLSPAKFARLLRRIFDLPPSRFLTQTRLAAAARLLRETDESIGGIGQACGFYDHSAFSRAFHSALGVTPSAYREATRKAPLSGSATRDRVAR